MKKHKLSTLLFITLCTSSLVADSTQIQEDVHWKNLQSRTIWGFNITRVSKNYETLLGFASSSPNCGSVIIDYLVAKRCSSNLDGISEKELSEIIDKDNSPENIMLKELHDIKWGNLEEPNSNKEGILKYETFLKSYRALNCKNMAFLLNTQLTHSSSKDLVGVK